MKVKFDRALILDVRTGVSKAGNEYGVLKFLDQYTLDVFEVMCFGNSKAICDDLSKGVQCILDCTLEPYNNGGRSGVSLRIDSIEGRS